MNVLSLQHVEKSYGTRRLLEDVTLTITTEQRLGLIGVNGTGKSTFLRILAGELAPDKGTIERNGRATIYYLAQTPEFDEEATILENIFLANHPLLKTVRAYERVLRTAPQSEVYMRLLTAMDEQNGWEVEQQAKTILTKLGLGAYEQKVNTLSGGQRRRLALGQALLYPCDLLLLDEPTNHLDEASIEWLEKYLRNRQGGLVVSTHDRYFLDAVSNGILELANRRFYRYEGNYETFLTLRAEREEQQAATAEKRRQFLRRELEWVRRGAQARSTKQKARLQRYEALAAMEQRRKADSLDPIALKTRLGKTIFDIEHLSYGLEGRSLVDDFTYHVVRHDRLGIVGPNGVGKSTFLKLLSGELTPTAGTVGRGETVRIGFFKQEIPEIDENMRVLDYIREDHKYLTLSDGSTLSAGQLLERFLFTPDLHGVPVRKLSGGEKRRLYLLKTLMDAPNVLLLDEPTNDLDIPTLEVLEDFLDTFTGIVIIVCHDRYFLDRVADTLFIFEGDGRITRYHGSYSDYRQEQEEQSENTNERNRESSGDKRSRFMNSIDDEALSANSGKKGLTLGEEKEYMALEKEIEQLEGMVGAYDKMLASIGSDYEKMQDILHERNAIQVKLDALTERWLLLEEKL